MRIRPLSRRLSSTDGFTIAEQLVTVIIVGFVTIAVVAGIGVAMNAFNDIRNVTDANAVLSNTTTAVTDELRFATGVEQQETADGHDVWAYDSTVRGYRLYLADSVDGITLNAIDAPSEAGGSTSFTTTGSSALPIAQTGTASGVSYLSHLDSLSYDDATHTWTCSLSVTDGTRTVRSGSFTVQAVNNW